MAETNFSKYEVVRVDLQHSFLGLTWGAIRCLRYL